MKTQLQVFFGILSESAEQMTGKQTRKLENNGKFYCVKLTISLAMKIQLVFIFIFDHLFSSMHTPHSNILHVYCICLFMHRPACALQTREIVYDLKIVCMLHSFISIYLLIGWLNVVIVVASAFASTALLRLILLLRYVRGEWTARQQGERAINCI